MSLSRQECVCQLIILELASVLFICVVSADGVDLFYYLENKHIGY